MAFMVIAGRFNADVFQQFLVRLIKYKRQKIYLATDGHPAHKAKRLQPWLAQNRKQIAIVFLQPGTGSGGVPEPGLEDQPYGKEAVQQQRPATIFILKT